MQRLTWLCALWIASILPGHATAPEGYYRFPALHGDTVVFTSEGDLWRVPVSGGVAQRLTTHPGMESHAAISPDGSWIAFAGQYEGPTEVYVMPLNGGLPTRLTFDNGASTVAGWSPEGRVLLSSQAAATLPARQLALIDPATITREWLPLAEASAGAFVPGEDTLFFTRLPPQNSSTKRYQGGWRQDIWRFAPSDTEAVPVTADYHGTSRNPMPWDGRIYFLTDRDGIMNLWSARFDGTDLRQLTRHRDFDIGGASLHAGRVVYQHGADLRLYDIVRDADSRIPITLATDFDQKREKWVKKPMDYLTSAHASPDGDRVVLTARGQIFVAPAEQGRFVEIPRKPGTRHRAARFMPGGTNLVALSDESGEYEFQLLPANGVGPAVPLTTNATVFRFDATPSPDGRWLAWSDKDYKFWIHDLREGSSRLVTESRLHPIHDFAWSPDSRWLAYVDSASNTVSRIHLYRLSDGTSTAVTSDRVDSYNPAWAPDGKWLYFLSDRELRSLVRSPWGPRQPDPFFTETTRIYALALTNGLYSPFAPRHELLADPAPGSKSRTNAPPDSENSTGAEKAEAGDDAPSDPGSGKGETGEPPAVVIELAGLATRLHEVPVPAGNYSDLSVTPKHLLWLERSTGFDAKPKLQQLEITHKSPKPKTLVEDVRGYELTLDRKKILLRKGDAFHVIPSDSPAPAKLDVRVNLDGWTFPIHPREEWRQIFTESWRMLRDYFYDRGMHKLDWPAMLAKYLPLVDRVSDRAELSDVISGMVGELSTLHVFVRAGDLREGPDDIHAASLGARMVRDEAEGGWRIEHIHRGDPDYPEKLSPLARPGIDVEPGDILVSIDGRPTLDVAHPSVLLRNKASRQVLIEVRTPGGTESRRYIVHPITAGRDADLRYTEWEVTRRERVEELGRGQIGYVHLRAMGSSDIADWARQFFPVFNRQGLIIDVRNNNGGNIDSWILGKLLRKAWFYWQPRAGDPFWNMQYAFRGHMVVICNARTASDGEAFAEGFRRLGLGKVIGTRTWGGEIWLSAQRWLVDSGMATAAEIGVYGPEGEWLIEGHGVDPDIVIDNPPHATFNGQDAQLEAAVRHLQELIERDPRPIPPPPAYPDKSFQPR